MSEIWDRGRLLQKVSLDGGVEIADDPTDSTSNGSVLTFTAAGVGAPPVDVDYLVATSQVALTNEIVVGTTPGGELGGTWASPTVDAVHSGSSHAAVQAAAEAAARTYADSIATGLNIKVAVRSATTANITLSGEQTIDGVAVVAGDRVLVKNQSTGANNGIYVASAGAWSRSTDADVDAEVTAGMFTFVTSGTTLADTGWVLATNNPITVGVTALVFTQFSSPNTPVAASAVTFTPTGTVSSTNVQTAIAEVAAEALGGGIAASLVDAKGDIIAATAADTVARLGVGTNGQVLTAASGQTTGLQWQTPISTSSSYLPSTQEWYVNPVLSVSGAGHSPGAGFKTFAEAHAAATNNDTIYIMGALTEQIVITKVIKLVGLGSASSINMPASLTAITDIGCRVEQNYVQFENITFNGHNTWKGTMLLIHGTRVAGKRVQINGTAGAIPTAYPTSAAAGTGIGGCGLVIHFVELGDWEDIVVALCSIGLVAGHESSNTHFRRVQGSFNAQHLVMGLKTGDLADPTLLTAPWAYGGGAVGTWTIERFKTGGINPNIAGAPCIDLIPFDGAGVVNSTDANCGSCTFIGMDWGEASGTPIIRLGTRGNTFINLFSSPQATIQVDGRNNVFIRTRILNENGLNLTGNNNTFDGVWNDGRIYGAGSQNVFRDSSFVSHTTTPMLMTGTRNEFDKCSFTASSGSDIALSDLGTSPHLTSYKGVAALTYGATVGTNVNLASIYTVAITNNTAFTMSNPTDGANFPQTNVLHTEPVTWIFQVGGGVTHGTISVGNQFALAGGGTTLWAGGTIAASKSRQLTCYFDFANTKWVELSRSAADIG